MYYFGEDPLLLPGNRLEHIPNDFIVNADSINDLRPGTD